MAALSSTLRGLEGGRIAFWCPGCNEAHVVRTGKDGWSFDGNVDAPTLSPSILVQGKRMPTDDEVRRILAGEQVEIDRLVCHSFVRAGRIQFLDDCTHALRGQTVPLPAFAGG